MATEGNSSRSVGIVAVVVLVLLAVGVGWKVFGDDLDLGRDSNDIRIDLPGGK